MVLSLAHEPPVLYLEFGRGVDVVVENAEVTLNGTVRHKGDRRRIEDVADIRGVRHVQNNLRVR